MNPAGTVLKGVVYLRTSLFTSERFCEVTLQQPGEASGIGPRCETSGSLNVSLLLTGLR
ncbi:MAG: hypothetical protein XD78_0638 [Desulfotomaculum sp. 46_296]|nr:MAG: hypothetical protein XD78_0638 [Desulfotomaculum sp. 46_296]